MAYAGSTGVERNLIFCEVVHRGNALHQKRAKVHTLSWNNESSNIWMLKQGCRWAEH